MTESSERDEPIEQSHATMSERSRRIVAFALAAAVLLALGACSWAPQLVSGSTVRIEMPGPITSLNAGTGHGGSMANQALAAAVNSGFVIINADGSVERDESFGTMTIQSKDPFTVRYELDERARWSDGTAVSVADLLLAWAANSGALNTPGIERGDVIDPETGLATPGAPADAVFFDGAVRSGLQWVTAIPQPDPDDPRALTLVWDRPVADWELLLDPAVPAHVLATAAFPERFTAEDLEDPAADAAASVTRAVLTRDTDALAPLARAWNTAFEVGAAASEAPVTSGPYRIDSFDGIGGAVLVADPDYAGDRRPQIERLELLAPADPLTSVQRLGSGAVDAAVLVPTPEVIAALETAAESRALRIEHRSDGSFEHLDLRFRDSRSGAVEHPLVRQALLAALSRSELVAVVTEPIGFAAEVRDSFVFSPAEREYAASAAANGSERYRVADPDSARRLLAESGVDTPQLCVLYDPAEARRAAMFALIRASAEQVGIAVSDCSRSDWLESLGDARAWDAALFAWRSTNPGDSAVSLRLRTGGATNFSKYSDAAVDALLARLDTELDAEARALILMEIDARLWADGYGAPLLQQPLVVVSDAGLEGVVHSPYPAGLLAEVWRWQPDAAR